MGGAYSGGILFSGISVRDWLGHFPHASGKKTKKALCFLNPRFNWKMIGNMFLLIFAFGIVSSKSSVLLLDKVMGRCYS